MGDEEDLGFDGPDIRPPQASKGSIQGGSRNYGSGRSDRDRKQGYSNYSSNSHQRGEGPGNIDPNRHRDRDHRSKGDLRRSGSGSTNNPKVTVLAVTIREVRKVNGIVQLREKGQVTCFKL